LASGYLGTASAGARPLASTAGGSASTSGLGVTMEPGNGRQHVFWRGTDARLYEASYGPRWRGPVKLRWSSTSTPAAAAGPNGELYLVWPGAGGHIFEAVYRGSWGPVQDLTRANHWDGIGRATSSIAVVVSPSNGSQYLYWRGVDGRIHLAWQAGRWHAPVVEPWRASSAPAAAITRTGHQYVFWAGANGHIEEAWKLGRWRGPLDVTSAAGWGEFGATSARPAVAVDPASDHQYLFWSAADGRIYRATYAHGWHGPVNMGWSAASGPAVAIAPGAREWVYWQGSDGTIWEAWRAPGWRGPIVPLRRRQGAGPDVDVVQTSAAPSERLMRLAPARFAGRPPPGLPVIGVNDSERDQRFLGVGAAMTDTSAWLIHDELSPGTRDALMNDLFGAAGMRLSFTLVPMGGTDFTRNGTPYTYDDLPPGQSDPQLARFSILHDQPYILPALRQMLQINPQTAVMATPWTAPPWMKANDAYGDLFGSGTLLSSAYQPFANYFVKFLQAYAAAGVPVSAIAPVNEPNSGAPFPSMAFPEPAEAQWISQNLDPTLEQAGLHPRVYGGDTGWATPIYESALASNLAVGAFSGLAWHCYGGLPTVMSNLHAQTPGNDQVVTECSQGIQPYPVPEVLIGSLRNWSSAVALWNLALDPTGGPVQQPDFGCPGCTGLVTIDESTQSVSFRLAAFQLGQVGAFVAPGAWRIASNSFVTYYQNSPSKYGAGPGLDDVAFLNPDGSRVLIVYNNSTRATRFAVAWNGRSFTYSLKPKAMVTFRWKP
jgi:glucosylceramidase